MRGISKSLIQSIASVDYSEFADNTESKVNALVSLAVEDMSYSIPFVSVQNCILQPANETFNGAITAESEFIYLLAFNSPQIEINCMQYNDWWKKFKERVVFAWNNCKRKKRRKTKKQQAADQTVSQYEFDTEKYNLDALKEDLQKAFAKNLSQTSIVYNLDRYLRIIGRDDFGPKTQIFIYPCLMDDFGNYKIFINRKKGFYKLNFAKRAEIVNQKMQDVGENFVSMLKILNTLFRTSSRSGLGPNQIFLESLLCGVPDEFYIGTDIYQVFLKIVNYLNLTDVGNFKSVLNPELTISQDRATKLNQIAFTRFLNSLNDINDNND